MTKPKDPNRVKITVIVSKALEQGLSNSEIIALYPNIRPNSIRSVASIMRRGNWCRPVNIPPDASIDSVRNISLSLDRPTAETLREEAKARHLRLQDLVRVLMRTIAESPDLIDAVLDDPRYCRHTPTNDDIINHSDQEDGC